MWCTEAAYEQAVRIMEPNVTQDAAPEKGTLQTLPQDTVGLAPSVNLNRRKFNRFASVLLASLTLPVTTVAMGSQASIKGVRLWRSPGKTRLVFDVSKAVKYKIFSMENPSRVVLDIFDTRLPGSLEQLDFSETPILNPRWSSHDGSHLRIVFDVKGRLKAEGLLLPPNTTYGHRLVIDIYDDKQAVAAKPRAQEPIGKRNIIVAIDAGHGGEDPGAIGHKGAREKDVVLAIAKEVAEMFRQTEGFTPVMIRTGDYYISLRKRTRLAREKEADVFVSIHADAFTRPSAKGSSVYTLAENGASSEAARWLADKENSSDLIGGEDGFSLDDRDDDLALLLLNLSATDSQIRSDKIGSKVLRQLGRINKLHKKKVEQATFAVLKNLDFPSLLVETGFITNPVDATNLRSKTYQRKMARAIYSGVKEFFSTNPPPGTLLASKLSKSKSGVTAMRTYRIKPGDTLSEIAFRHDVSLNKLLALNDMGIKEVIRIGQTIRIP